MITGFEPLDLLEGLLRAVRQLEDGRAKVENQYGRVALFPYHLFVGMLTVIKDPLSELASILFGTNFAPGDWHDICAMPSCVPVRFPGWHGGSDGQTTSTSFAAE